MSSRFSSSGCEETGDGAVEAPRHHSTARGSPPYRASILWGRDTIPRHFRARGKKNEWRSFGARGTMAIEPTENTCVTMGEGRIMDDRERRPERLFAFMRVVERGIFITLALLMMLAVVLSTIELAWILISEFRKPPVMLLDIRNLLEIFGFFMMILIGLELLEIIKSHVTAKHIQIEIVLLVALIAIARKVIILEFKAMDPWALVGIAATILGLSVGYFLVARARKDVKAELQPGECEW